MPPEPRTSIWQSPKDGRCYLHVSWPGTGRRKRLSLRTLDMDEAERRAQRMVADDALVPLTDKVFAADAAPHKHPRLDEMAAWYFDIKLPQADAAPNTVRNYRMSIDSLVRYAAARRVYTVNQLSSRLVQDWQATTRNGAANRDDLLATRHWLHEYRRFHPETRLPAIEWSIPKKRKLSRFKALDREQLGTLLSKMEQVNPELYRATAWIAYTGWLTSDTFDLRYGEIRHDHIDRERIKTSRRMMMPLTDELRALIALERARLDEAPAPDAVVFRNRQGEGWRYQPYAHQLGYFCRSRLDFTFCARDLRVTYGTFQAEAGCPQHILAELMGHDDVTTALKYYTRVNFAGMQKAAAQYTENVRRLSMPS